ncbi:MULTISPECIES: hypothetical protein [unclassified Paenibacillus]|uniref:hypothetical protein n=1 Tax=unclassified Paenibacillus TaxID=185978 RepID=UPI0038326241
MKYFYSNNENNRIKILKNFDFDLGYSLQEEPKDIAGYVYEACEKYIPNRLIQLFCNIGEKDAFIKDIKEHLAINSYIISNLNGEKINGDQPSTRQGLIRMRNEINEVSDLLIHKSHDIYVDRSLKNKLQNVLERYYGLESPNGESEDLGKPKKKEKQEAVVPYLTEPFVYFVTWIDDLKESLKERNYNKYFLKLIHNIFNQIITKYTNEQQIVSKYLFEKEYNVLLVDSINKSLEVHPDINRKNLAELFGFAVALPNVNSRNKYIDVISKALLYRKFDKDQWGDHTVLFSSVVGVDPTKWFPEIRLIILQHALIALPLMELFHYHLICYYEKKELFIKKEESFDDVDFIQTLAIVKGYKDTIDGDENYLLSEFVKGKKRKREPKKELPHLLSSKLNTLTKRMEEFVEIAETNLSKSKDDQKLP